MMSKLDKFPFPVSVGDTILSCDDNGCWCIVRIDMINAPRQYCIGKVLKGYMHKRMSVSDGRRTSALSNGNIVMSPVFFRSKIDPNNIDHVVAQMKEMEKPLLRAREIFLTKVSLM